MNHSAACSLLACLLFMGGLFSACQFEDYLVQQSFEDACWSQHDTLAFAYEARGTSPFLRIEVAFLEDYAYRNCYLKLIITPPGGPDRDTLLHAVMLDERGFWKLEPTSGTYVQPYPLPLSVQQAGTYQFQLIQYMREETLCQVAEVRVSATALASPP